MPRKIRELIKDLKRAGFQNRGGKGSHRNFIHPRSRQTVLLSGQTGADARRYQEEQTQAAIEASRS